MARVDTSIGQIMSGNGEFLQDYLNQDLQNCESDLLVSNGEVYKIIAGSLRKSKQPIMEFLHDTNHDLPIDLHDLFYENDKFFGYSMEFYEEYATLNEVLKQDIPLSERKAISLELVKLYEKLLSLKIVYFDWHSKNLLFKDCLKLLDIDSGKLTTNVTYDAKSRRFLLMLCLSILHGIDFDFDSDLNNYDRDSLLEILVDKEEIELSQTIPLDFDFIKKEINGYTQEMVCYKRELMINKGFINM